jgi:hypothetical protein
LSNPKSQRLSLSKHLTPEGHQLHDLGALLLAVAPETVQTNSNNFKQTQTISNKLKQFQTTRTISNKLRKKLAFFFTAYVLIHYFVQKNTFCPVLKKHKFIRQIFLRTFFTSPGGVV